MNDETKELLASAWIAPFYAVGFVTGYLVRLLVTAGQAVRLGFVEAWRGEPVV